MDLDMESIVNNFFNNMHFGHRIVDYKPFDVSFRGNKVTAIELILEQDQFFYTYVDNANHLEILIFKDPENSDKYIIHESEVDKSYELNITTTFKLFNNLLNKINYKSVPVDYFRNVCSFNGVKNEHIAENGIISLTCNDERLITSKINYILNCRVSALSFIKKSFNRKDA